MLMNKDPYRNQTLDIAAHIEGIVEKGRNCRCRQERLEIRISEDESER